MTPDRHGSAVVEYPNDLEIVIAREFDAPIGLVFDVMTKPEHVSKSFAPFAFRDQVGRDHMNTSDGTGDSLDKLEDLLRSLLNPERTVAG